MRDKVVVITGGSTGIGKALAEEFGRHGSNVLITGRTKENLVLAVEELRKKGITISLFVGDVGVEEDNRAMTAEAIRLYNRIDVLINNAGISMRAAFEDVDLPVIHTVMNTNFYGAVNATRYCLPEIKKTKGSIVGISSIAGIRGLPGRAGYSSSKFALTGFLEVLRTELLPFNINVLTVYPGFTASEIRKRALNENGIAQGESPRDEKKMMTAEECAKHIYQATVKRKRSLVLTAQGKIIILLNKWWPALADKIVYGYMAKEKD
ncbi:MAG: SDR family oxidoreductase [Flammeovirgaceae bacterium]|nr:SDR family oxidoreductase [Flammeovirgaceae bacterium]